MYMEDVTLTDLLSAFHPNAEESICLRAFKAKDAPDVPKIHPLMWQVTKARLRSPDLQGELKAANRTRGIYFVVNSGGNTDQDITRFNSLFVEIDMPEADWQDETRRAVQVVKQKEMFDNAPFRPFILIETLRGLSAFWLINPVGSERRNE